jgi:toxin-antitoxin system PIN domain toxin
MISLVDSNVWLSLAADGHIHHTLALQWFDLQAAATCGLCRITQMALLRHVTNSKIMGVNVQTQAQAWVTCDTLLNDPRVVFLAEPLNLETQFRGFTQGAAPAHKLWTDAYLAAFAISSAAQLVTLDRGFHRFPGLAVLVLGE